MKKEKNSSNNHLEWAKHLVINQNINNNNNNNKVKAFAQCIVSTITWRTECNAMQCNPIELNAMTRANIKVSFTWESSSQNEIKAISQWLDFCLCSTAVQLLQH